MKPIDPRDQAIERMLRRSLQGSSQPETSPDCLDAEAFATWADEGLHGAALEMAEAHVAGCVRCQAMAAVMMRATPIVAAALPWWRRSLRSAWLVPVTVGAAAVALWAVVPNQPPASTQPSATVGTPAEQAEAKADSQPPLADRLERRAEATRAEATKDTANSIRPGTPNPDRAPAEAGRRTADATQKANPALDARRANEERDQGRQSAAAADTLANARAAPRAVPSAPAAAPPPVAPPAQRSDETPSRLRETAGALMKQEAFLREIASPDPALRWRIGSGGAIDRTDNGGKTWTRLSSGVTADLIAGASPSAPICWVVGRDSTVLRTSDGRSWARVNIPEVADLVGVEALDAKSAVVTASDGRRFRTTSGGQTWIKETPR